MEVNSKQTRSHHIPCLSGSSQAPLISAGDNGSERSTPISLPFSSPNRTPHQSQQISTPLIVSSASINVPTSIFFPPRITNKTQIDINMNAEHERDREIHHTTISPNQTRLSAFGSSKLQSPLSRTVAKSFPAFFPESQPFTFTNSSSTSNSNSNWSQQQDDTYHLYHEPIDPDEQSPTIHSPKIISPDHLKVSTPKSADHLSHCSIQPHARSNMITLNASTSKDWAFAVPSSTTNKSPTISNGETSAAIQPSSPFNDRAGPNRRKDVSADIYFCYVTLKSNERANHRSRSYHGPKNTESKLTHQMLYTKDATKNLSSTSVTDLPMTPSAFASSMIPIHFRDHCVRELIETESNYVHALDMIITSFARPLEPLLKKEDNQLIFGHIKYFHAIHSAFQTELVRAAYRSYNKDVVNLPSPTRKNLNTSQNINQTNSNPSTPTVVNNAPQQFLNASPVSSPTSQDLPASPSFPGHKDANVGSIKISSCFLNMKDKFLKYGDYCATLSKAQALLDELSSKNDTTAMHLDRCQQDANEGKFKLRDLLSLPMQRILKYHLLLAQLIKNTSSTNDDYHGLKRAHETMVDLGQYINEAKRDTEAIQIINDIEQSVVGLNMPSNTQLTDYGRLITDGFIRVKMPLDAKCKPAHDTKLKLPHDFKIKQKRYVFVFDKVMLMCKLSGVKGYQYKEALVLSEFEIETNPTLAPNETSKHPTKEKWSYWFNLIRSSDKTIYSFYAKTLENKNKWVEAILKAMDNIRPAATRNGETNHEFLMHTFEKASSCDHCGKLLLGLYYQGYRCRICFAVAHKKCLSLTRLCGPSLPPKSINTLSHNRVRCNEPPSPSIRSICSDDGHNAFLHFPSSNSSSTQCVNVLPKNEYSNIDNRGDGTNPSSSFRENVTRTTLINQRPVSSMINVSLQNSTNHLLQQRRLLKGSTSTPAISHRTSMKAKALSHYDGNEDNGHLRIKQGDLILVYKSSVKNTQLSHDDVDHSMGQLNIGNNDQNTNGNNLSNGSSWWFGKNLRTDKEGQFPSSVVEILSDQNRIQMDSDNHDMNFKENLPQCEAGNSYVNFILNEYPWFCGRMERDKAQSLIEAMPHGTFLVRVSPKHNGSYVISLNYNSQVKHMRIYVSKDNQLYLSQNRYFKSVIELVNWYEKNSLVESFHMLDARLTIPFKA